MTLVVTQEVDAPMGSSFSDQQFDGRGKAEELLHVRATSRTLNGTSQEDPMHLTEDIKPVTYMKTQSAELLQKVGESRRPVVITQNGEAKAVLMDIESYEALKNAALLLKLVGQGESDVEAGRTISQEDVFAKLSTDLLKR